MTLAAQFAAVDALFVATQALAVSLPGGQQTAIASARASIPPIQGVITPNLTSFYNNFTGWISAIRAIQSITKSADAVGAVGTSTGLLAGGGFLNRVSLRLNQIQAQIALTPTNAATQVAALTVAAADAVAYQTLILDISAFILPAQNALKEISLSVGGNYAFSPGASASLSHAAEFSVNSLTLRAATVSALGLDDAGVKEYAIGVTDMRNITNTFVASLLARIATVN